MTASIIRFVAKTRAPTRNSNNFNEQMSRIPTKNVKSCCCRRSLVTTGSGKYVYLQITVPPPRGVTGLRQTCKQCLTMLCNMGRIEHLVYRVLTISSAIF